MVEGLPPVCSACESPLGAPEEEIEHPDDPDPPDDAHFKVQIRSDDEERLQCKQTGKLAKVLDPESEDYPLPEGEGQEGSPEPTQPSDDVPEPDQPTPTDAPPDQQQAQQQQQSQQTQQGPRGGSPVYDIQEDKDQIDILMEVVSNPSYGLSDEQIQEIRAWAHDYGGQMPPDALEDIVGLMSGVQKQTAQLIKQRYELKLNKWVRERTQDQSGPLVGIGTSHQMPMGGGGMPQPEIQQGPSPEALEAAQREHQAMQEQEMEGFDEPPDAGKQSKRDRIQERRQERQNRREEAIDAFAEEMAIGTAENLSQEAGEGLVRFRNLILTVLESKAQKDPDWFFEMAERLDVDPVDLLEPSEARKREMEQSGQSQMGPQTQVDGEVDDVMSNLSGQSEDTRTKQPERVKEEPPNDINERTQDAQREVNERQPTRSFEGYNGEEVNNDNVEEDDEEEDAFEEIFG